MLLSVFVLTDSGIVIDVKKIRGIWIDIKKLINLLQA